MQQTVPYTHNLSHAAFRTLFSLIFLVAGIGHLVAPAKIAARLESAPFGYLATSMASAETLVLLAGVALVAGGTGLLAGAKTRLSALLLIAVLVPITLTVQVGSGDLGPLFKNVALLGGLIHFATNGAPALSVDRLFAVRRPREGASDLQAADSLATGTVR
jgi:putative oxidoreductase